MSKFVKQLLAKELEGKFTDVSEFVIVDMTGIDGNTNNSLRGQLGEKGIKLTMVKNSLARQAVSAKGFVSADSLFATGSCTVAYGADNAVDLAKEIKEAAGKLKIKFKGAYLDGEILDAAGAANLVNMKSRSELQADVIMLAKSPGARIAGAITSPASRIAGCIESLVEKLEEAA